MVFFKAVRIVDASEKYGDGRQTIIAAEPIAAGEKIWWCSCGEDGFVLSKDEIFHLIEMQPNLASFLCWYSNMVISFISVPFFRFPSY